MPADTLRRSPYRERESRILYRLWSLIPPRLCLWFPCFDSRLRQMEAGPKVRMSRLSRDNCQITPYVKIQHRWYKERRILAVRERIVFDFLVWTTLSLNIH